VGKFQDQKGQDLCTACAVGQHQPSKKMISCTHCSEGRYQNAREATACIKCAKGRFGAASKLGESDPSYCQACVHGKFNPASGSTTCTNCLAGKAGQYGGHAAMDANHCTKCAAGRFTHMDGATHEHRAHSCSAGSGDCDRHAAGAFAECLACPRVDALRYQWNSAGETTCRDVKLDCTPSTWGSWGSCTKSCTPMVGTLKDTKGVAGSHYRTRHPAAQMPCNLPNQELCAQAWGGGVECSALLDWVGDVTIAGGAFYKQTQSCNEHACPVDCVPGTWGGWSTCTKTCAAGTTTRTRSTVIADAFGGKACTNAAHPELHKQASSCNADVSCSKWDLPTCQLDHVHCEIKAHTMNAPRAWHEKLDSHGVRYYHNTVTAQSTYVKPATYVSCADNSHTKQWHTTGIVDRGLSPFDTHSDPTSPTHRVGEFRDREPSTSCLNNQNCGLLDAGSCHDCDSMQECKDMGLSSTLFVTHHRKYMHQQKYNAASGKYEQVKYHCRREGQSGCKCTCDAHPPCVVKQGFVLRECKHEQHGAVTDPHHLSWADDDEDLPCNRMLHGNAYPNVPNMQDCCNMCTNHPKCDAWEYSSTKMCVLKSGTPAFKVVPASSGFAVWSGCRAGEAC
jgi:hypothetical protein